MWVCCFQYKLNLVQDYLQSFFIFICVSVLFFLFVNSQIISSISFFVKNISRMFDFGRDNVW